MLRNYSMGQFKAMIGCLVMMIGFGLANATVGYFVTPVTETLEIQRASFTLYYTVMQLVGIAVMPIYGKLFPKINPKRIMLFGGIWGAIGFMGFSICSQLWMFYFFGAWLGLVTTGCTTLLVPLVINSWFSDKSGGPTGIAMAGSGVCGIIMGFILPTFLQSFSWRAGYRLLAAFWLFAYVVASILIGKSPETQQFSSRDKKSETTLPHGTGMLFSQAIRSSQLYLLILGVFVSSVVGCFLQHMPAFFVEQGASQQISGSIMSTFSLCVIFFKIAMGTMFDRIGPIKTLSLAFLLFSVGFFVALSNSIPFLYLCAALLAVGMSALTVLPPLLTRTVFGVREYASIYSLIAAAYSCGNATGAPVWGLVHDVAGSYIPGALAASVVLVADLALMILVLTQSARAQQKTNPSAAQ